MTKFIRVEIVEVECDKVTMSNPMSDEEGYIVTDEHGYKGFVSKDDFEKKGYIPCNSLPYPLAYYMLQQKKADFIRLPQWKEDVKFKVQFPDRHSKITAPYTFVESRFGNVPHKTTVIEEWNKNWELCWDVRDECTNEVIKNS